MIAKSIVYFIMITFAWNVQAVSSVELIRKITSQGVPREALLRLLDFMYNFQNRSFVQDVYTCPGVDPTGVKPCEESKRTRASKIVTLGSPRLVAIIDYGAPSTDYRFFLIDLVTGDVSKLYASHGLGSGKSNVASKFSNIKDSKQTSLGFYLVGETYSGKYGKTLRMYGLQGSNDQSYNRDIVLHGAWYVGDDFINSIDPKTGEKFGRLGLSWGCPAVAPTEMQRMIASLQMGGLVMHYHGLLMDAALSGAEVTAP